MTLICHLVSFFSFASFFEHFTEHNHVVTVRTRAASQEVNDPIAHGEDKLTSLNPSSNWTKRLWRNVPVQTHETVKWQTTKEKGQTNHVVPTSIIIIIRHGRFSRRSSRKCVTPHRCASSDAPHYIEKVDFKRWGIWWGVWIYSESVLSTSSFQRTASKRFSALLRHRVIT